MASPHQAEITLSAASGATSLPSPLEYASVTELFPELPTTKTHGWVYVEGAKDYVPWTAEFPEGDLAYDGLVLLLPGFGGIKRSSRGERHANALAGRATISYDPARMSSSVIQNLTNAQSLHTHTAEAVMFAVKDRLATDHTIPNATQLDADRWFLSPHSMGGYAATDLSLIHPDKVETVVYKASAGFGTINLTDINYPKFAKEMAVYIAGGQIEPSLRNLYKIARYYGRNPSRTAGEAWTCLSVNMAEKVAQLGDIGIQCAYLGFAEDGLVRPEKARPHAEKAVRLFEVMPNLGHLAPQSHPQETAKNVFALYQRLSA